MKRRLSMLFLTILLFGQSLFLSGCWSVHEVEDLALFTGGSIDLIKENGKDKYVTNLVIISPPSKGTQSEQPGLGESSDLWFKGQGETYQEAIIETNKQLPRIFSQSHLIFEILGENLAKEEIVQFIEANQRFPAIRPNMFYFVTKGEASRIIQAIPVTVQSLSAQFGKQPDIALKTGVSCGVTLTQFSIWMLSPDRDPVLPEVKLVSGEKGNMVIIEGFGVFRGPKLVGWLDKEEARGYLLMTRKLSGTYIPIPVTIDGQTLNYFMAGSKYKIQSKMVDGKLSFKVIIETRGIIVDNKNYPITAENVKELEQILSEEIKKYPLKTIAKAKENNSDFLGLMEDLHRHNPAAWQEVEANWRESFSEAEIEVEVKAKILSGGMGAKSFEVKP